MKLKEEREAKRASLGPCHEWIILMVSDILMLERSEVEDCCLEGNQVGLLW